MSAQTIHIWGINGSPSNDGSSATICAGDVATVAEETMRGIRSFDHQVTRLSRTSFGGEVREETFEVVTDLDGKTYRWLHVFTAPRDPWLRLTSDNEEVPA